jgi:large subunit ribosomal protein L9
MKLILKQDVKNLGYKDDIVEVKNGYGRNFLIPQGMGRLATTSNVKMLEEDLRQRAFKLEKVRKDADEMASKMEGLKMDLKVKAGATGKIFGSITTLQVANELKSSGFEVDRRNIVFENDIKNVGEHKATINLHREVSVDIEINIVAE